MSGRSARGVLIVIGVASAAVWGFAAPASAHPTPTHALCNCSTTSTATTTSSTTTTTTLPPTTTTTEATTTTIGASTSTMDTTTSILLVPPVTATAPPGKVIEQEVTSTTRVAAETDLLPHTGSSPLFPITFALGCLVAGVALALRRKPREWYGR